MKKAGLLLLFMFWVCCFEPSFTWSQDLSFRRLGVADGLPDNRVYGILQAKSGFMWFSTYNGLSRYDGYTIKTYRLPESTEADKAAGNYLFGIIEDRHGKLWMGSMNGLRQFDPVTEKFTLYRHDAKNPESLSVNFVSSILEDQNDIMWLGTVGGGLNRFDVKQGKFTHYRHDPNDPESLGSDALLSLKKDREGNIWMGSFGSGLFRFNPRTGKTRRFVHEPGNPNSLSGDMVNAVTIDPAGYIWAGSFPGGINRYDPATGTFKHIKLNTQTVKSSSKEVIFFDALYLDRQGTMWIGTSGDGLYLLDTKTFTIKNYKNIPDNQHTLSQNYITSFCEDRNGLLWVGTESGFNITNPAGNKFTLYQNKADGRSPMLPDNYVISLLEDRHQQLWIGTKSGGLVRFDRKKNKYRQFQHDPENQHSLNENLVQCIYEDRTGQIWIGTDGRGFNLFQPQTQDFKAFSYKPGNPAEMFLNDIHSMYEDDQGRFWLITHGGLLLFDRRAQTFTPYRHQPGKKNTLSSDILGSALQDRHGNFWISTWDNGLNRLTGKDKSGDLQFKNYLHQPGNPASLSSNGLTTLFQDSKGRLWIGSNEGLNLYIPETDGFKRYAREQDNSKNLIYGIQEDQKGNLWLSTGNGLCRFNPETGTFKVYDETDGLQSNSFSGQFQSGASCRGRDGTLYFGGPQGFNAFHPDSIRHNRRPPALAFTNIKVLNEPLAAPKAFDQLKEITLPYSRNIITFEFAALDYLQPGKNQYAYQLEGFNPEWVNADTRNSVTYTNLDPGTYVLKVKGANSDGVWNEAGISLRLVITPPFWRTRLAYAVYALLLGALLFGLYRQVIRQERLKADLRLQQLEATKLQELDTAKSRFFSNITHEFRTPLTLILAPLEKLRQAKPGSKNLDIYQMMYRNAHRLLNLINQLLTLSKLESNTLKLQAEKTDLLPLLKGLFFSFESLAANQKINLKLESPEDPVYLYLDRDKFEKVLLNLLSNAFKFTPAGGQISLAVQVTPASEIPPAEVTLFPEGYVGIQITDSGCGMAAEDLTQIFNPFYQARQSGKIMEGTGLGLALVQELTALQHGRVEVSSTPGQGTCFGLYLPLGHQHLQPDEIITRPADDTSLLPDSYEELISGLAAAAQPYEDNPEPRNRNHSRPLLLVVEDNAEVRQYIRDNLKQPYRILEARDGLAGAEMAITHIPDLIISDVMMPGQDGIALCRQLKEDLRTSHIPLILLTAKTSDESKIQSYDLGADDYILKPFRVDELLARVANLIKQRKKLREVYRQQTQLPTTALPDMPAALHPSGDEKFLKKALLAVEEHIADPEFGVEELGRELGMSRVQLFRKVKALTGLPGGDFIRIIRLKKAAQLLESRTGNVAEVAYEVGFNDPSYFTKCFTRFFQKTPSEFVNEKSQPLRVAELP